LKTFADAMANEGATPLAEGVRRVPPSRSSRPRASTRTLPTFEIVRDDDWVEGHRTGLGSNARSRLRGTPLATLDLHRLEAEAARRRVSAFLAKERANGRDLVLVIVGRGRHSPGGHGVLRHEIADFLTTLPTAEHVLAFRTASRELGGAGAVVVLLSR
jgi:DNA-nicking Smr family endonuclease